MNTDYKRIYQEFEKVKHAKEYLDYSLELEEVNRLLNTYPFDADRASQVCSHLAGKYEKEINQQPGALGGKTVVKVADLSAKTSAEIWDDLLFFQTYIPVFALKREIKNEVMKVLLGI